MNKVQFYILAVLCISMAIIFPFILPEKFYLDANLIVKDPLHEKGLIGSYPLTMLFYSVTKLSSIPYSLVALLQLPILFFVLRLIGVPNNFHVFNIKNILVYLSFVMMAVFIGQPSKEFITFVFMAFILLVFEIRQLSIGVCLLFSFLMFGAFGAIYRPYFAFMPFIATAIYLITKIKFTNRWLMGLFNGILVIFFISMSHGLVKGQYLGQISREEVNISRIGEKNADTMIDPPISPDTWYGEAIGTVYGFFSVNFPVNALRFFYKPQVVAFVVWQILIFWIVIVRFGNLLNSYPNRKKELWLMLFVLSYFIIQGVFEPDLGSAIRHKIGVLPIIYFILYYDQFKREFL